MLTASVELSQIRDRQTWEPRVKARADRNNGAEAMFAAAMQAPFLSAEEETQLVEEARAGSSQSFERLLKAHLRLVFKVARGYTTYGFSLDELVAEGLLGLVEAATRFDAERSVRLATYATWWIRAYIRRYTVMNRRIVRTPSSRNGRTLLANLRRTQRELAQRTGEQPDARAVAEILGVSVSDVEEMESALSGRDVPCGFDGDGDDIASVGASPEALFAETEEREVFLRSVQDALKKLTDRERRILEARYRSDETGSLAAIGRGMGLSRERVRQLEHQAYAKMRHAITPLAQAARP